jgi:hypothetical protein
MRNSISYLKNPASFKDPAVIKKLMNKKRPKYESYKNQSNKSYYMESSNTDRSPNPMVQKTRAASSDATNNPNSSEATPRGVVAGIGIFYHLLNYCIERPNLIGETLLDQEPGKRKKTVSISDPADARRPGSGSRASRGSRRVVPPAQARQLDHERRNLSCDPKLQVAQDSQYKSNIRETYVDGGNIG